MNAYAIILALVGLGGIVISIWGWRVLRCSQQTKQWPTTAGVIEESKPGSEHDDLLPHIVYRYETDGQALRSSFEFPSGTHPMPEFVQAYLKKYPVGVEVTVYYNPQQPQQSTLEPGAQGDWMILVLGIMMAVGGIAALLAA